MAEALNGPFAMHGARDAIAGGLGHIEEQVKGIERAVVENPGLAFDLAKTLVESVCRDDAHGTIRIFEAEFRPSDVLFQMEPETYRVYLAEFDAEAEGAEAGAAPDAPGEVTP